MNEVSCNSYLSDILSLRRVMGIDPGKNFGLAVIGQNKNIILNGVLDDSKIPLRECAFHFIKNMINIHEPREVVIEGASYGDRFGQVKLAEIRCGFALGSTEAGVPVIIVPPKTPRKAVFGSGNTEAMDVWTTLNHNAADALCLALYPFYKEVT